MSSMEDILQSGRKASGGPVRNARPVPAEVMATMGATAIAERARKKNDEEGKSKSSEGCARVGASASVGSVVTPKGYWIAHVTVTDPEQYTKYIEASRAAFVKFKATPLARGGACQVMEGDGHARNVVLEFPSLQAALDCYASEEYQAAKALRKNAGIANLTMVEGV